MVQTNYRALEAGIKFVEEHFDAEVRQRFVLQPGQASAANMVVSGNQATALGAIAAGCSFFSGYPITPASDVMEFLAAVLPKVGGAVIQAEDEISAINMIIGAGYAGKRSMTSTSGPGLSLMVEALGLATMAEIPCVIVDAQRAGPSTGMPTRHEQGDLYLCAYGAHGEVPRIVLSATSVEDCFYLAVEAFNLAEKYQSPVILMTDTVVAVRTEGIKRPELDGIKLESRLTWEPPADGAAHAASNGTNGTNGAAQRRATARNGTNGAAGTPAPYQEGNNGYLRYELTESGISPMSIPGTPGGQYVAMGLEHNEKGRHRPDPRSHTQMTDKRFKKFYSAAADAPDADHLRRSGRAHRDRHLGLNRRGGDRGHRRPQDRGDRGLPGGAEDAAPAAGPAAGRVHAQQAPHRHPRGQLPRAVRQSGHGQVPARRGAGQRLRRAPDAGEQAGGGHPAGRPGRGDGRQDRAQPGLRQPGRPGDPGRPDRSGGAALSAALR